MMADSPSTLDTMALDRKAAPVRRLLVAPAVRSELVGGRNAESVAPVLIAVVTLNPRRWRERG
jgi:hypothetical protein